MEKMALEKREVLKIFGITNNTLDSWEQQGYIRRMNTPGNPKYSMVSVEKLLYDGTDNLLIKKEREIRELKEMVAERDAIIEKIKGVIST